MNNSDKTILINLTQPQAKFLLVLFPSGTITANASGASQTHFSGKIVAGLRTTGIVEPMGFKNQQRIWSVTPLWEKKWEDNKEEIQSLLNKITNS